MKRNNIKYQLILKMLGILIMAICFTSCEKDQHVRPTPGPFEVLHEIPEIVPVDGGNYSLTIDASTNGWWITVPDNGSWVAINRKYGSAKIVQNIVISPNSSGEQREVSITVNGTNEDIIVIQIKQQG